MAELYQVIGAVLRDVAQARFMSDIYARQISHVYQEDTILREFPVPRTEIEEVEVTLPFVVQDVQVDPNRHTSSNAAIGSLFDQYSLNIVRDTIEAVRRRVPNPETPEGEAAAQPEDAAQKERQIAARANFEKWVMSAASRELLSSRVLRYFNDNVSSLILPDGQFASDKAKHDLRGGVDQVLEQKEVKDLQECFPKVNWNAAFEEARDLLDLAIDNLAKEATDLRNKYPDFKIEVDVSRGALKDAVVSSIKIKGQVKNYKWSKVDVDESDLRNIRTLSPE